MEPQSVWKLWQSVREKSPLVQCITNFVRWAHGTGAPTALMPLRSALGPCTLGQAEQAASPALPLQRSSRRHAANA